MSFVSVHIPDDGWFLGCCNVTPQYGQICVVVHRYGKQTPGIWKADWLHSEGDYFLDVAEKWWIDSLGGGEE